MITILLINFFVLIIGSIFSLLPAIETLPTINGYDIDGALVTASAMLHKLMQDVWILDDFFKAFLVLMAYFAIKMIAKFFLGNRTPTASNT